MRDVFVAKLFLSEIPLGGRITKFVSKNIEREMDALPFAEICLVRH